MDEATEDNYANRTSPFRSVSGDKTDGTENHWWKSNYEPRIKDIFGGLNLWCVTTVQIDMYENRFGSELLFYQQGKGFGDDTGKLFVLIWPFLCNYPWTCFRRILNHCIIFEIVVLIKLKEAEDTYSIKRCFYLCPRTSQFNFQLI